MDGRSGAILSDAERLDWLRLARVPTVGAVTFHNLLRRYGSAADALAALPDLAARAGGRQKLVIPGRNAAEAEIAALTAASGRLVAIGEPDYPAALTALEDAPPLLSAKGPGVAPDRPVLAIVGARNASALAVRFTREIAGALGSAGLIIASGLARGIDRAAHEGSLDTGTIAVVGGGIDIIYPPENTDLYDRIAERGLILAEMPVGTQTRPQHFPRRNRIISGASLGVLVVEAALRSGSLITARFALEQGREVLAVPGSPLDPRCRGTNDLLRQGATLVEGIDDVLRVVAPMVEQPLRQPAASRAPDEAPAASDATRALILEKLGPSPVGIDELARQTGIPVAVLQTALFELELAGLILRHRGNAVSLV